MGTGLSSELGKIKVARKGSGTPPQLHCYQKQVGSLTAISPTALRAMEQPLPCGVRRVDKMRNWHAATNDREQAEANRGKSPLAT